MPVQVIGSQSVYQAYNVETGTDMFQLLVDGLVGTKICKYVFYFTVNKINCSS